MPTSQQIYRDACRRLHRALGNYFAIRAWCSGSDCLILQRNVLEKILELERLKKARMAWIKEDLHGWFPHITTLYFSDKDSVGSLYLSRIAIAQYTKNSMSDETRAKMLNDAGIKTLTYNQDSTVPTNATDLLAELNLMAAGLAPAPVVKLQSRKKR